MTVDFINRYLKSRGFQKTASNEYAYPFGLFNIQVSSEGWVFEHEEEKWKETGTIGEPGTLLKIVEDELRKLSGT
nr:hypothetical protein [Mycobacterium sp. E3298]